MLTISCSNKKLICKEISTVDKILKNAPVLENIWYRVIGTQIRTLCLILIIFKVFFIIYFLIIVSTPSYIFVNLTLSNIFFENLRSYRWDGFGFQKFLYFFAILYKSQPAVFFFYEIWEFTENKRYVTFSISDHLWFSF